jgi:2-oxoisovalerate dehydrogenase E2 component (dihydrolipoyl transacylase)
MPSLKQFRLPDLGEGLTEGEIIRWLVQPGDTVTLNQPIVEIETAKAAVEVPSPFAGVVTELHHQEGATVDVGTPIITFDVAGAADQVSDDREPLAEDLVPATAGEPGATDEEAGEPGLIGGPAPGGRTSVLVGYGPRSGAAKRRARKPVDDGEPAPAEPTTTASPPRTPPARVSAAQVGARAATAAASEVAVLAKPPVRKLARDLGVDLRAVPGTGPHGSITRSDVEAAAGGPSPSRAPDRGTEERIAIRGVRRATAAAMVSSAFTAPHVTEFLTVDVTPTMELTAKLRSMSEFDGLRVSPLLLVARALLLAVRRHPMVNSTWDEQAQEIVVRHYVNLGIAAATPRGLVVPNVKDADQMALPELAAALQGLTDLAREGKTPPADMLGGTITITNVGVFGVDTGTPILNPGEAAILCFGVVRPTPWVHEGQIAVRQITQLGLSFDHRIVDGQLGSEFLADVGAALADPTRLLVWS